MFRKVKIFSFVKNISILARPFLRWLEQFFKTKLKTFIKCCVHCRTWKSKRKSHSSAVQSWLESWVQSETLRWKKKTPKGTTSFLTGGELKDYFLSFDLYSLMFINLTAAVIQGADLHCRLIRYCNVDCFTGAGGEMYLQSNRKERVK